MSAAIKAASAEEDTLTVLRKLAIQKGQIEEEHVARRRRVARRVGPAQRIDRLREQAEALAGQRIARIGPAGTLPVAPDDTSSASRK